MTFGKTASTHVTEPLEKLTFGKRYYVVDDQKHVWGADLEYDAAVKVREKVAGNLWSKTPTVKEMPQSKVLCGKLVGMVRGPDNTPPPRPAPQPAPTAAPAQANDASQDDDAAEIAALESAAAATGNGSGHDDSGELDDDEDLESLLNS